MKNLCAPLIAATALLAGCAHSVGPAVDRFPEVDVAALREKFGYPRCKVSVPLTPEEALDAVRRDGVPHPEDDLRWQQVRRAMKPGDELRWCACVPAKGRGGVVLVGLFRDRKLIEEWHTIILD